MLHRSEGTNVEWFDRVSKRLVKKSALRRPNERSLGSENVGITTTERLFSTEKSARDDKRRAE
jgi:hypothetical protein